MMRGGNAGTNTTTTIRPAGQDHSGWVLLLGGGLLLVNFTFGSGSPVVSYFTGQIGASNPPKVNWGQYVLMALALLILLGISKTGEGGSGFAVIFLVAVWIIWLLNSTSAVQKIFGQSTTASTSSTSNTSNTSTTNKTTGTKPA